MKKSILSILFAVAPSALADIIKCNFTEPFVSVQYSMTQSRLIQIGADLPESSRKSISFQIFDAGHFELWDSNRRWVMRLKLDHNGSDGMSGKIYPYSAEYRSPEYGRITGGCTSNFLKAYEMEPH